MIDEEIKAKIETIRPDIERIFGGKTTLCDIEKYSDDLLVVLCTMYAKTSIEVDKRVDLFLAINIGLEKKIASLENELKIKDENQ